MSIAGDDDETGDKERQYPHHGQLIRVRAAII
jgi:hypothetical protein